MSKNKNTEYRVQSTDTFESQLTASARRLRKQSESNLSIPEAIVIPQKHTRY